MPYTPTVWQSGDIVTSEKLNKLEQGVADATSEQIIDSWLEENISQETGYALDRTLTLQNAAAPADMVGDLKSALGEAVGTKTEVVFEKTDGYYVKTNASVDVSSPYYDSRSFHGKSTFISCQPGDVFTLTVATAGGSARPWSFWKSDGTQISVADNVDISNVEIVAPENASYVAFNCKNQSDTVTKGIYTTVRLQNEIDYIGNPYKGKKAVAFGTSLTYNDAGYRPYLAELLGMTIDNQGIGSSHWQWWQENTSNILYNVQQYANYSDKDVCIIEGCVNDWAGERVLGTFDDTTTDTVCGCLYNMISHVYTQNPNIQIFVILDHFGRNYNSVDCSPSALNNDNKTQYDYYTEIVKTCEFYGIPCIKEYALASIGIFGTQFLADQIHLTTLGGKQSAQIIASEMVRIKPKKRT